MTCVTNKTLYILFSSLTITVYIVNHCMYILSDNVFHCPSLPLDLTDTMVLYKCSSMFCLLSPLTENGPQSPRQYTLKVYFLIGSKGFCCQKSHFSFVKKCEFCKKICHKSWISPISSEIYIFITTVSFRHLVTFLSKTKSFRAYLLTK